MTRPPGEAQLFQLFHGQMAGSTEDHFSAHSIVVLVLRRFDINYRQDSYKGRLCF